MVKKNFEKFKEEKEKPDFELENIPFIGGLLKGIEKLVNLAEKVEESGGKIERKGEIKTGEGKIKGIYGFSIRTGIGEKAKIQTFGNIRPVEKKAGKREIKITETREPVVDVFDEKDYVLIVAELPGATKESIKLNLKGDILILEAGNEKREYSKEILLPAIVDIESLKENFNNGVLEIKIKKTK